MPSKRKRIHISSDEESSSDEVVFVKTTKARPTTDLSGCSFKAGLEDRLATSIALSRSLSEPPARRYHDEFLDGLVPRRRYTRQKTPANGDCLYYSLALVMSKNTTHYELDAQTPSSLTHLMLCLRKTAALSVYAKPSLLQMRMAINEDPGLRRLPLNPATGLPAVKAFVNYYAGDDGTRSAYPYADAFDINELVRLAFFERVVVVIFNATSLRQTQNWVCDYFVPPQKKRAKGLVILRRSGSVGAEHYEPILWRVGGEWTHVLPLRKRKSSTFAPLFQSMQRQCPSFKDVFNSRNS